MIFRHLRRVRLSLSGALLILCACGPGDSAEFLTERARVGSDPVRVGATAAERFGGEVPPATRETEAAGAPFRFDLPEGWKDEGARSMRVINLLAGEESQCYVIVLGGEGGGLVPNLNRWRGEVGLEPATADDVAAMPTVSLLGSDCPLLEVTGDYQGMGGGEGADKMVLGTLLIRSEGSVFIKMVGPGAEVAAHKDSFIAFVASLEEVH